MQAKLTHSPIGVFDSGIGGLSVYQQLTTALPNENWVYLADSANAPYGEKDNNFIWQRCNSITKYLVAQHHIKLLIVACNTATAICIDKLRHNFPQLPIIGLEPAIKPALALTKTQNIAVFATQGTINSSKFNQLITNLKPIDNITTVACNGLAKAIEDFITQQSNDQNAQQQIASLIKQYWAQVIQNQPATDLLVLGCTHYPLVKDIFTQVLSTKIQIIDSAIYIVKRCQQLLNRHQLTNNSITKGQQLLLTSANEQHSLANAAQFVLNTQQGQNIYSVNII